MCFQVRLVTLCEGRGLLDSHFVLHLKATDLRRYIEVVDDALPSDLATWKVSGKPAHGGGHGLRLIKSITHKVDFISLKAGNKACLYFWKW